MRFNLDLLNNFHFNPECSSQILGAMKKIYPNASDEELREGKENLENYLKLALRMSARLLKEKASRSFDIVNKNSYDDPKVESNPSN